MPSDRSVSHSMELPRRIVLGRDILGEIGDFLSSLAKTEMVSAVTGPHVGDLVRSEFEESLSKSGIGCRWHIAKGSDEKSMTDVQLQVAKDQAGLIVGIGGGRAVDAAKMAGYGLGVPFASVPTAASHDGIASPFVSVKAGEKPHSIVASAPLGVFVDIGIIEKAPKKVCLQNICLFCQVLTLFHGSYLPHLVQYTSLVSSVVPLQAHQLEYLYQD